MSKEAALTKHIHAFERRLAYASCRDLADVPQSYTASTHCHHVCVLLLPRAKPFTAVDLFRMAAHCGDAGRGIVVRECPQAPCLVGTPCGGTR
jgi:hypothetical protein